MTPKTAMPAAVEPLAEIVPELLMPPEKVEIATGPRANAVPVTLIPAPREAVATILPLLVMPPPKVETVIEP